MYETTYEIPINDVMELYNKSVEFSSKLLDQLGIMTSDQLLEELYNGRSLIQELYNEFNFQLYVLDKLTPINDEGIAIKKSHTAHIIRSANKLEETTNIPWDGHPLLNNTT